MFVHYIWIGSNNIPPKYLFNFQQCTSLNPNFNYIIWKEEDCVNLLKEYNLFEYSNSLSFISKCNLLKYLTVDKFGGIYTDFDIKWNIPFSKIMTDNNFPYVDIILTSVSHSPHFIDNKRVLLLDDPFIVSKKEKFKECIDYCMKRTQFKLDGDLYMSKKEIKQSPLEPIGPFGLTEWVYRCNINFSFFPQDTLLDFNGYYGNHDQKNLWKSI